MPVTVKIDTQQKIKINHSNYVEIDVAGYEKVVLKAYQQWMNAEQGI